jgi:hypothetical protein
MDLLQVLKVCLLLLVVILDSKLLLHQIYKDATLFFSQDKVSTIAHVIPTMDRIDLMLSGVTSEPLSPSVKHALTFAHKSINKYYSKTDVSNVYRIAMGRCHRSECTTTIITYF